MIIYSSNLTQQQDFDFNLSDTSESDEETTQFIDSATDDEETSNVHVAEPFYMKLRGDLYTICTGKSFRSRSEIVKFSVYCVLMIIVLIFVFHFLV